MSTLLELAEAAENTALGLAIAESTLAFPILEGLHLLGLSFSVGLIALTDLRLLGLLLKRVPAALVLRQLRPWVLGGFALVFLTGGLLFFAEAVTLLRSPAFPFKLGFIALAGLNALYFERVLARRPGALQDAPVLPAPIRAAGFASLLLWVAVVVCGRLIPYLPSWS